eukprot:COSAG02_NODE_1137_length_14313_cov_6.111369_5_plen_55_part_00
MILNRYPDAVVAAWIGLACTLLVASARWAVVLDRHASCTLRTTPSGVVAASRAY